MARSFTGGCLCGAVHYECTAKPVVAGHCQCTDCRRASGTGHSSHMAVPAESVTVRGKLTRFDKAADSGNVVTRAFCPVCGSQILSTNSGMPDLVFIRASSLDDPEVFRAQMVVYSSRGASWDLIDPALPAFPGMAPVADEMAKTGG